MDIQHVVYTVVAVAIVGSSLFMGLKGALSHNLIYFAYLEPDKNQPRYMHAFAVRTIMPDEGDSFDIFCYRLIDLSSGAVTKGLEQRGKNFDIRSNFAARALADMRDKTKLDLAFSESMHEDHGAMEFVLADSEESDTEVRRERPETCFVVTKFSGSEKDRFQLEYYRKGKLLGREMFKGNGDYLRRVIHLPERHRLYFTYASQAKSYHDAAIMRVELDTGSMTEWIIR